MVIAAADPTSKDGGHMRLRARPDDDGVRSAFARDEEHVLRCLGAAVIMHWDDLPNKIQRELFDHAIAMGEPGLTQKLKKQVAQFIHKHHRA
jgi:hypothetical protein